MAAKAANEWLQVRVTEAERKKTDELLKRVQEACPILTRAQVLRAALREGLAVLDADPSKAVTGGAPRAADPPERKRAAV